MSWRHQIPQKAGMSIVQETMRFVQSLSPEQLDLQVSNLYPERPNHYPPSQRRQEVYFLKILNLRGFEYGNTR